LVVKGDASKKLLEKITLWNLIIPKSANSEEKYVFPLLLKHETFSLSVTHSE
jgi:hypothetical protein